jgi:hypothetical protein
MPGKVYSSRTARPAMTATDWLIAVAIAGPYAVFLLAALAVLVLG